MTPYKRKTIEQKLSALDRLLYEYNELKDEAYEIIGGGTYDNIAKQFQLLKEGLVDIKERTPVGHLYEGVYYYKHSDSDIKKNNQAFSRKEGRLFMREDLISWTMEKQYGYYRNLYKTPNFSSPLLREDGKEVFSIPENF